MRHPQHSRELQPAAVRWTAGYLARRGTGPEGFRERLARARLLYLRRRELAWNWLALLLLAGCWDAAGRLDAIPAERVAPAATSVIVADSGLAAAR